MSRVVEVPLVAIVLVVGFDRVRFALLAEVGTGPCDLRVRANPLRRRQGLETPACHRGNVLVPRSPKSPVPHETFAQDLPPVRICLQTDHYFVVHPKDPPVRAQT